MAEYFRRLLHLSVCPVGSVFSLLDEITASSSRLKRRFVKIFHDRYCAVLRQSGDILYGIGDMDLHEKISPEMITKDTRVFDEAPLVIMDGNISLDTMKAVMKTSEQLGKVLWYEPTDVRKATKPFLGEFWTEWLSSLHSRCGYIAYKYS